MGLKGSKNYTTTQKVTAGKPGKSAGEVGSGGPGSYWSGVKQDKDMGMSTPAKNGANPSFKSKSSEH